MGEPKWPWKGKNAGEEWGLALSPSRAQYCPWLPGMELGEGRTPQQDLNQITGSRDSTSP